MTTQRREILKYSLAAAAASALPAVQAQVPAAPGTGSATAAGPGIDPRDRVFITNEDSNTLVVIDPRTNTVESTINLTSPVEHPRSLVPLDFLARPRSGRRVSRSRRCGS